MNLENRSGHPLVFFAPEHGGDAVAGGGHPADSPLPATEPIDDAFGQNEAGRGKTPGVGVPGTKTNPVGAYRDAITARAQEIWEEEGRPEGRAEEHWLRAEAELGQRES
ncbi:MAG: DUF2934 domain-containing protein [Chthoniobacterales bacterium]